MHTKKCILLTGASGFLGSHLVRAFLSKGHNVVILKRPTSNLFRIADLVSSLKLYDTDTKSLHQAFSENKIDVVVHTACHYGRNGDSDSEVLSTNVLFGVKILELACAHGVNSFVNTHTLLPRELNVYSLTKFQFLDWLVKYDGKIKTINVRPEHLYGPKDDVTKFVPWLLNQMLYPNDEIRLTTGIQKRDFIYIDDVVAAYVLIIDKLVQIDNLSTFDIGTGSFMEVRSFVDMLTSEVHKTTGINPQSRLKFGAIQYRVNEIMEPVLDNSGLCALGWTPKVGIKEGIRRTVNDIIL